MAQGTFQDGDALSVVRTTINANANDAESRLGALEFSIQQVVFVSKDGNDSDNGLNVSTAKLTIGAAITAAGVMSPAEGNQVTIQVIDSATYTEDFSLPEWVHLRAPISTINGRADISNNCIIKARRLENTTGTGLYCVRKNDSGGLAKVEADIMIVGTGNEGVRVNGGQIGLIIDTITVDGGEGLLAKNGSRLAFTVQFMSLSNSADGITTKTVGGAANSFYGNILRVEDDGTCCLIKTKVDGDNLHIQGGSFIVNELYNLGINSTLNIFVNESVGAKVADPTAQVNILNVSGDSNLEGDLNVEGVLTGPSLSTTVQNVSGVSATQVLTDKLIVYDTSSNDGVVNLLAAALWAGKILNIKKTSALNKVTIDPNAAELIDGLSSLDFFNRNESITIMSDGVGIKIV